MAYTHSYSQAQLQAATMLIELINPKTEEFNQKVLAFNQEIEKDEYEVLPIYEAIFASDEEQLSFKAENPQQLLEKVQNLAWRWGAFVHFERHNWADMYKEIEKTHLLLTNLAQELKNYGLSLWTWQKEKRLVAGFMSKSEDSKLIKKLSENCGYPLEEI